MVIADELVIPVIAHEADDMPMRLKATGLAFAPVFRSVVFFTELNVVPANVTSELFVWRWKAPAACAVSFPASEMVLTIPTEGAVNV